MTVPSVPVMTTTTSASSGELYSHLPANSVTHSNSDATERRWRYLSQYEMTQYKIIMLFKMKNSLELLWINYH